MKIVIVQSCVDYIQCGFYSCDEIEDDELFLLDIANQSISQHSWSPLPRNTCLRGDPKALVSPGVGAVTGRLAASHPPWPARFCEW